MFRFLPCTDPWAPKGAAIQLKQKGFLSPSLAAEGDNGEGIPDVGLVPLWANLQHLKATFTSQLVLYTSSWPRGRSSCIKVIINLIPYSHNLASQMNVAVREASKVNGMDYLLNLSLLPQTAKGL